MAKERTPIEEIQHLRKLEVILARQAAKAQLDGRYARVRALVKQIDGYAARRRVLEATHPHNHTPTHHA